MFGELKSVTLYDDEQYALITFKDFISAFFAQQSFNNHFLSKYNAILVIKWLPKTEDSKEKPESDPKDAPTLFATNNVFKPFK